MKNWLLLVVTFAFLMPFGSTRAEEAPAGERKMQYECTAKGGCCLFPKKFVAIGYDEVTTQEEAMRLCQASHKHCKPKGCRPIEGF